MKEWIQELLYKQLAHHSQNTEPPKAGYWPAQQRQSFGTDVGAWYEPNSYTAIDWRKMWPHDVIQCGVECQQVGILRWLLLMQTSV